MDIRAAAINDYDEILQLHRIAFGSDDEPELTRALLATPEAAPMISLVAESDGEIVGHILLTKTVVAGHTDMRSMMLAPLGVVPEHQQNGVGTALTKRAIKMARDQGVDLIFLAGHPDYYPRFGFQTHAEDLGFKSPAPMPPDHSEAWMVLELTEGTIGRTSGCVIAAAELMDPKYWEAPPEA